MTRPIRPASRVASASCASEDSTHDPAGAVRALRDAQALSFNPDRDLAEIAFDLGDAYTGERRVDEAIGAYREALRRRPWHPAARPRLARLLRCGGRWQDLLDSSQEALVQDPLDPNARRDVIEATCGLGQYARCVALSRAALADSPGDAAVHLTLGNVLLAWGRKEEARAEWTQALTLDPSGVGPAAKQNLAEHP